jgi:hypothetical protein
MVRKGDKRGSHVGVVVSFMLFVAFILFIILILEPALRTEQTRDVFLQGVENNVINKSSAVLKTVTISVDSSVSSSCVSISSFFDDFGFDERIVINSEEGDEIGSSVSDIDSSALQIERNSNSENLLKIHNSEVFSSISSSSVSCESVSEGSGYNVGITKKGIYIFEDRISGLISDYSDYDLLREELNVPNGTDLGIAFFYQNGSSIETFDSEPTTNIYVDETPVEYVDNSGRVLSGRLRIRIW